VPRQHKHMRIIVQGPLLALPAGGLKTASLKKSP